MAMQFFGKKIEKSCTYCTHGEKAADGTTILCSRKGIVSPFNSCRHFSYDPLKRTPPPLRTLPVYSAEDFSLETEKN